MKCKWSFQDVSCLSISDFQDLILVTVFLIEYVVSGLSL